MLTNADGTLTLKMENIDKSTAAGGRRDAAGLRKGE